MLRAVICRVESSGSRAPRVSRPLRRGAFSFAPLEFIPSRRLMSAARCECHRLFPILFPGRPQLIPSGELRPHTIATPDKFAKHDGVDQAQLAARCGRGLENLPVPPKQLREDGITSLRPVWTANTRRRRPFAPAESYRARIGADPTGLNRRNQIVATVVVEFSEEVVATGTACVGHRRGIEGGLFSVYAGFRHCAMRGWWNKISVLRRRREYTEAAHRTRRENWWHSIFSDLPPAFREPGSERGRLVHALTTEDRYRTPWCAHRCMDGLARA
jgi:hypothetical protein